MFTPASALYKSDGVLIAMILLGVPALIILLYGLWFRLKAGLINHQEDAESLLKTLSMTTQTPLTFQDTGLENPKPFGSYTTTQERYTTTLSLLRRSENTYILEIQTRHKNTFNDLFSISTKHCETYNIHPPPLPTSPTGDDDFDALFTTHTERNQLSPNYTARSALTTCTQPPQHLATHADQYSVTTLLTLSPDIPLDTIIQAQQTALHSIQDSTLQFSQHEEHHTQPARVHATHSS